MNHYPASLGNQQRGFTIVMAIFIVVVLALLGGYMVRLTGVQHATATYALQSARAYQVARSGLGWASATINQQAANTEGCRDVNLKGALSLPDMSGFTTTLTCTPVPETPILVPYKTYQENKGHYYIYIITAHSEFGAYDSTDYVSRQLEKSVITYSK
jgi:MSHA biogenesis protein MshP